MLLGRNGELRKSIQKSVPVRIVDRGTKVVVLGEANDTERVGRLLDDLLKALRKGHTPTHEDVAYALQDSQTIAPRDIESLDAARTCRPGTRLRRPGQLRSCPGH